MKKTFFLFSLIVVAMNASALAVTLPGNIYVMGDSLAYGTGAPKTALSPTNCLQKTFANNTVFNLAAPGKKSREFLQEVRAWTETPQASLIFVSMGGNDEIVNILKPGIFPKEESLANMSEVFETLRAQGATVVYLGLNHPSATTDRLPLVSALAQSKGALVVDGMAGLWGTEFMADNVHPNANGYAILCDRINDALKASGVISL